MPEDRIEELLSADFTRTRQELENDGFSERLLRRLSARRGRRLAVVSAAGGVGAAFAAAQFAKMSGVFSAATPFLNEAASAAAPFGVSFIAPYQLMAAAVLAIAFLATAFILQSDI